VGIGVSVFLIALGAILTFALDVDISGLDIAVVGWILMGAGVLGLLLSVLVWGPRRRSSLTERRIYDERTGDETVEQERRYDSGGPPPVP
jgi:hypothetical protein